jgi:hypothetical protein
MKHIKKNVIKTVIFITIGYLFLKNYQHNLFIKAQYQKQRLESHIKELEKERNNKLMLYYKLKDPVNLITYAEEKLHMVLLNSKHIVIVDPTFTTTYIKGGTS